MVKKMDAGTYAQNMKGNIPKRMQIIGLADRYIFVWKIKIVHLDKVCEFMMMMTAVTQFVSLNSQTYFSENHNRVKLEKKQVEMSLLS